MRPASVGFMCPDDAAAGSTQRPLRTRFGGVQRGGRPYVTLIFLGLNIIGFILQGFPIGSISPSNTFTNKYEAFNYAIAHNHEYYRLLTGAFLHYAIWHIAVNMLVLIMVGPALEASLGRWRYVVLYLLCAIGGNVLPYLVENQYYASLGASGAIFGLFAAYWVIAKRVGADTSAITGTIILNVIISLTFPGISLFGHLGGLITGAVIGAIYAYSGRQLRWQIAGLVAVTAVLVIATLIRTASLT
jgi:membrane associated rhomboid family serine protease